MKIVIQDGRIVGTATDAYEGPDDFIQVDEWDFGTALEDYCVENGELVFRQRIPEEVSIGQCRLALYDLHGIYKDEDFMALVNVLPQDHRERATLQLRTRTSVRFDNELVDAICTAKGWDKAALFIHAGQQ